MFFNKRINLQKSGAVHCAFFSAASRAFWRFFSSRALDVLRIQPIMTVRPSTSASEGRTSKSTGGPGITPSRGVSLKTPCKLCFKPVRIGYRKGKARLGIVLERWIPIGKMCQCDKQLNTSHLLSWTLVRYRKIIIVWGDRSYLRLFTYQLQGDPRWVDDYYCGSKETQ